MTLTNPTRLTVLFLLITLAGCTSIPLLASRDAVCKQTSTVAIESQFVNARSTVASTDVALSSSAASVSPTEAYGPEDLKEGLSLLNQARSGDGIQLFGGSIPVERLIPWIDEYSHADPQWTAAMVAATNDARKEVDEARLYSSALTQFAAGDGLTGVLGDVSSKQAGLMQRIGTTLASGGYDGLTFAALGRVSRLSQMRAVSNGQFVAEAFHLDAGRYVSTYFRAYFRGGHVLQVGVDTAALASTASQDITDKAAALNLSDSQKQQLQDIIGTELKSTLCRNAQGSDPCLLTQPLGSDAFVTRSGTSVQFAGLTVTFGENGKLTPATTFPKGAEWGPQVARVFFEAVFDSAGDIVPASANSTECKMHMIPDTDCVSDASSDLGKKIATLDQYSAQAESATTSAVGYVIRGGWLIALNNEAVAQTVETSAGVIARKAAEKLIWAHEGGSCASKPVHVSVGSGKNY